MAAANSDKGTMCTDERPACTCSSKSFKPGHYACHIAFTNGTGAATRLKYTPQQLAILREEDKKDELSFKKEEQCNFCFFWSSKERPVPVATFPCFGCGKPVLCADCTRDALWYEFEHHDYCNEYCDHPNVHLICNQCSLKGVQLRSFKTT